MEIHVKGRIKSEIELMSDKGIELYKIVKVIHIEQIITKL